MSVRTLLVVPVALLVAGCGLLPTQRADEPTVQAGEAADHEDRSCPAELPIGDDPDGYGFGVEDEADELPSLLSPERAWVCRYDLGARAPTWKLGGEARELAPSRLDDLTDALDDLTTLPHEYGCDGDLGPRWLVVYEHGGDLTGVVVDDYGCDFVRVTEEPFTAPAGESDDQGMVRGVLDGGGAILDVLDR
jgi:hypothetical protein